MMKLLKGIKIEKIGYGGIGLARMSDGKRILIKGGALPGSVVDLRVVKQRKDYIEAHILHIHKHDPALIDGKVFCPHFFRMDDEGVETLKGATEGSPVRGKMEKWKIGCGGCKWQMLSYPTQLKLKQDIVQDAFKKLASSEIEILPIVGSPLEKGYRNKIEFSFGKYITNKEVLRATPVEAVQLRPSSVESEKRELDILSDRSIGFHKQGEFSKIVDIDSCGLISEKANTIFARIKELCLASELPVYDQMTHQGFFRHLALREGFHTDQILVNISVSDDNLIPDHQKNQGNEVFLDARVMVAAQTSPKGNKELLGQQPCILQSKTENVFEVGCIPTTGETVSTNKVKGLQISKAVEYKQSKTDKRDILLETFKKDELLKKAVTTFVITYNNGLADTIRNNESETKTFRGDGYIYEKLVFNNQNNENQELTTKDQELSTISFRVSPFSFFQTNTLGAEQLFSLAMRMASHVEGTILDLYCGTGSIGLSFLKANEGDKLIGIEIVQEAIMDAQHNAKINGLENQVLFVADPAEKALTNNTELRAKIKDIGLVIVDPPRDGLHKNVVAFLGELKKEQDFKLLYISCNPITMVRDIELLLAHGFQIKQIQPVDMFPQTHHIEVIGVLN